jgi:hypothetical protein
MSAVEHRPTELMQAGEGELHIRLDTGRPCWPEIGRAAQDVIQPGALTDTRVDADNQHAPLARPNVGAQSIDQPTLTVPVEPPGPILTPRPGLRRLPKSMPDGRTQRHGADAAGPSRHDGVRGGHVAGPVPGPARGNTTGFPRGDLPLAQTTLYVVNIQSTITAIRDERPMPRTALLR